MVLVDARFKQGLYNSILLNVYEVIPETFEGITVNREVPTGKMIVEALDFSSNFLNVSSKKAANLFSKNWKRGIP